MATTTKRRNHVELVDLEFVNDLLELASKQSLDIEFCEGSLQDNYIIYDTESIVVGRVKPRKNIILVEQYLNEWSSCTKMIMTDSDKVVREYEELFEKWNEEE